MERPCIRCSIREAMSKEPTWLPICEVCNDEIHGMPHEQKLAEMSECWRKFEEQRTGRVIAPYVEWKKKVVWRAEDYTPPTNPSSSEVEHVMTIEEWGGEWWLYSTSEDESKVMLTGAGPDVSVPIIKTYLGQSLVLSHSRTATLLAMKSLGAEHGREYTLYRV
ncbi:hypothetical protein LCGC14_2862670, partial [marine sediment metagenome]